MLAILGLTAASFARLAAQPHQVQRLPPVGSRVPVSGYTIRHVYPHDSRAFTQGMAPLTIGLLLATGWVLAGPAAGRFGSVSLVAATVLVMMRTKLSPMWAVAAGAVVGALGWA